MSRSLDYWTHALELISFNYWYPCGSAGKESACNVGDLGLIPGLGRYPGEGKAYPLQYSCLKSPRDRGAIAQRVAKSRPGLSNRAHTRELQETVQREQDKGCRWNFKGPEGILSRMLGYSLTHPPFFHSSRIYGAPTLSQNLPSLNPMPFQFP